MYKSIPNILSSFRIITAPFLLYFAWVGSKYIFLILLAISLLSDVIDGYIARKYSLTSGLGAKLDSWGDMANYMTVPFCAWLLWPEILGKELVFLIIIVGSYIVPILAGLIKFQKIPSYHTWGAKIAAVIMSISAFILFITGFTWPFRCAAVIQVIIACEEVYITVQLPELKSNVKSFIHVKREL